MVLTNINNSKENKLKIENNYKLSIITINMLTALSAQQAFTKAWAYAPFCRMLT